MSFVFFRVILCFRWLCQLFDAMVVTSALIHTNWLPLQCTSHLITTYAFHGFKGWNLACSFIYDTAYRAYLLGCVWSQWWPQQLETVSRSWGHCNFTLIDFVCCMTGHRETVLHVVSLEYCKAQSHTQNDRCNALPWPGRPTAGV